MKTIKTLQGEASYAFEREDDASPGHAWGITWVVFAPWAHPLWNQYAVLLYDLTTEMSKPPFIYMVGATHEVLVYAVDPQKQILSDMPDSMFEAFLRPPNMGYQFKAESNDEAAHRIRELVMSIVNGTLSPDTDFRVVWNGLFLDGVSLAR